MMNITQEQFERIKTYLPRPRGNVEIDSLTFINAVLYVAETGCTWRALPEKYGKWNSVYYRCRRWANSGDLHRMFLALQKERIVGMSFARFMERLF